MREASRERTLGSASMTGARNSGRRPPAWMPGPEDPLMMASSLRPFNVNLIDCGRAGVGLAWNEANWFPRASTIKLN